MYRLPTHKHTSICTVYIYTYIYICVPRGAKSNPYTARTSASQPHINSMTLLVFGDRLYTHLPALPEIRRHQITHTHTHTCKSRLRHDIWFALIAIYGLVMLAQLCWSSFAITLTFVSFVMCRHFDWIRNALHFFLTNKCRFWQKYGESNI